MVGLWWPGSDQSERPSAMPLRVVKSRQDQPRLRRHRHPTDRTSVSHVPPFQANRPIGVQPGKERPSPRTECYDAAIAVSCSDNYQPGACPRSCRVSPPPRTLPEPRVVQLRPWIGQPFGITHRRVSLDVKSMTHGTRHLHRIGRGGRQTGRVCGSWPCPL